MMGYIDTNCYNCVAPSKEDPRQMDVQAHCEYQGKGIFKCPNCGWVLDLSRSTYDIRINVMVDPDCVDDPNPWLEFEIIEPIDPLIIEDSYPKKQYDPEKPQKVNKKLLLEEMHEYQEEWWDGSTGLFDVELFYLWTSSGYYMVEWDLDIVTLKKTPVKSDKGGKNE